MRARGIFWGFEFGIGRGKTLGLEEGAAWGPGYRMNDQHTLKPPPSDLELNSISSGNDNKVASCSCQKAN